MFQTCSIHCEWKTCVIRAFPGLVCARECVAAATSKRVCVLFGAAAASSSVQGWEEQRFCVCIGYICLQPGHAGMTGTTPRAAKLSRVAPPPISPSLSWTLEASIPPSALALIITKDRMHKTWRTLRQRRPRSPFPLSTLSPGTIHGPSGL